MVKLDVLVADELVNALLDKDAVYMRAAEGKRRMNSGVFGVAEH
jgi:hypothetical protein